MYFIYLYVAFFLATWFYHGLINLINQSINQSLSQIFPARVLWSIFCKIKASLVKVSDWNSFRIRFISIYSKISIRMNPRIEWFKLEFSIRIIPTSDSLGLENWSRFIRIQTLGLTRIKLDKFSTDLHQTKIDVFGYWLCVIRSYTG